jgi:hypothetical protein
VAAYPTHLAKAVSDRWDRIVSGEYVTPECPEPKSLAHILDVCYLAANAPEEGRYPRFNVVVTAKDPSGPPAHMTTYPFAPARPLSVSELRRLAPATDVKKSAVWVTYHGDEVSIAGLADLGTSWHRARMGLSYQYRVPDKMIIQVDRPGRIKVFQGQYHVASLADGDLAVPKELEFGLFLHESLHDGLDVLAQEFTTPSVEQPRDYENFWFIALFNVFAAVANSVSSGGHGGMIILLPASIHGFDTDLRTKYATSSSALRDAFIAFINARNTTADFWETAENTGQSLSTIALEAEIKLNHATDNLVEAIRFIAQLSGCDGAIVITSDLRLMGFGAEVRAEMDPAAQIAEVDNEFSTTFEFRDGKAHRKHNDCDVEQFGMRHRAAIKLASKMPGARVLAISQDGPISAVWREEDHVLVRKSVSLPNMNMPWS